jgi:glycerol-3-phosphate acyltransferase PlsX
MGGDHGVSVVVPAALKALKEHPSLKLILVGDQTTIADALREHGSEVGERLSIHHATQVVAMDEAPSSALRSKKDSSMRVAINLVKQGQADASVSAGNTGALMATARFVLKTLPGIDRPAIISSMPSTGGCSQMLDLGANIESSAEHLFQFAVMGSVLSTAVDGKENPTVGLLNIGEEDIKGGDVLKQAAKLLQNSELNYYGFVEGDDIYKGTVDVVVADGFAGNIALKASEGVARMIITFLKEEFKGSLHGKLAGLFAKPILKAFGNRIDPGKYNGASFVGLRGIVVKSHGGADVNSFANAIEVAIKEVEHNVPARIERQLESMLVERRAV